MTQLLRSAIYRLEALPTDEQEKVAARIHEYLTQLDQLCDLVPEGLDDVAQGDTLPFDTEDIIRRGESRKAQR